MASEVDSRAIAIGSIAGGIAVFFFIAGGMRGLTMARILTILAVAPLLAGIPAGICVGLLQRNHRGGLNAGGLAAVLGTQLGIFGFATMRAIRLPGLTLGERIDVVFVAAAYSLLPMLLVFPFIFMGGALVARHVGSGRHTAEELELHDLPVSEE